LSIFRGSFLLIPGFFPGNEEISAPPPSALLIEIYLFYENWSNETFRKKDSKRGVPREVVEKFHPSGGAKLLLYKTE
jgi:hypothetical protein